MQFGSYFASFLLHAILVLAALLWPTPPPLDLTRTVYQVSLVDGAPGGEMLPSPVSGKQGDPAAKARAETRPAPDAMPQAEAQPTAPAPAAPAPTDLKIPEQPKASDVPRPESVPKAVPQPPKPDAEPISPSKIDKPEPPKPVAKAEESPKPKAPEPPKPVAKAEEPPKPKAPEPPKAVEPPKAPEAPKLSPEEALKAALADTQKLAGKERPSQGKAPQSSGKQAALSSALADMQRQSRRQGTGGGGGGEGEGPGGGGINDVYVGLVIMAVQPQWSTTTFSSRQNLAVVVNIRLDADGNILDCRVERSSGNAAFDGSALNAVRRTRALPKPPTPEQQELIITFNSQDMMAR